MVFNEKEYNALMAKLKEMKSDDGFKVISDKRKEERKKSQEVVTKVFQQLQKQGLSDDAIKSIGYGLARIVNSNSKEE